MERQRERERERERDRMVETGRGRVMGKWERGEESDREIE